MTVASNFRFAVQGLRSVCSLSRHTMSPWSRISHAWSKCASPLAKGGFMRMRSYFSSGQNVRKSVPTSG